MISIITENKLIFDSFGPYSKNAKENQMATELMWEKLCVEKILPNNRMIELTINSNYELFNDREMILFSEFKIHREDFEVNKISGDVNASVLRFPNGFEKIFI